MSILKNCKNFTKQTIKIILDYGPKVVIICIFIKRFILVMFEEKESKIISTIKKLIPRILPAIVIFITKKILKMNDDEDMELDPAHQAINRVLRSKRNYNIIDEEYDNVDLKDVLRSYFNDFDQ